MFTHRSGSFHESSCPNTHSPHSCNQHSQQQDTTAIGTWPPLSAVSLSASNLIHMASASLSARAAGSAAATNLPRPCTVSSNWPACMQLRQQCRLRARSSRQAVVCRCQHSFVLYTKPDCPLCDGLKDKLQALIDRAAFMPSFLTGATIEVRDISTNTAWQDAMHLSVPVLAVLDSQGQEVVLPRPQPRVSADRLQQHLQRALEAAGISTDSGSGSSSGASDASSFSVIT